MLKHLLLAALFLGSARPAMARSKSVAQARRDIVYETMRYLNVPYLWGGQHPQTGLDCSGFVQLVYHKAGFGLPRHSRTQFDATRYLSPSQARPGDLVFFAMNKASAQRITHVGIYMGKGYFIHASSRHGIHINHLASNYYLDRLAGIRKFKGF